MLFVPNFNTTGNEMVLLINQNKLERVQERALRAVFQDKTSCYEELLVKANLHTLNNKRLQDIAILMYKVKNELAPKSSAMLVQKTNNWLQLTKLGF